MRRGRHDPLEAAQNLSQQLPVLRHSYVVDQPLIHVVVVCEVVEGVATRLPEALDEEGVVVLPLGLRDAASEVVDDQVVDGVEDEVRVRSLDAGELSEGLLD